ncbi:MAG: hypothetical protein UY82_C0032G0002 [Candidatus Uhrbacteria bacterium GW2011_GWC2_53_7]|uniref:Transcriptional regulator, AbiEi antitoxin, Type IV TA system n=1 Tax=Candidatus Uhrbacteria bacterium GW2011_GWC2_53_7 TaxID=1618986 RepID=A0A0G1XXQ0_9BACT|nr:MAG: hypothetical protein UY82_C0032G0002 [Candidatus Uhrbacteria bacterium GW2011_GWC2_53_7]
MKYEKKPISDILRSPKTVFTFKDISLIWGNTDKKATIAGVNYYVKKGDLYRIRRGIYGKDKNYDKQELATRIFTPSYISFETVLGQSGVTFQYYSQIFVASYLKRDIVIDGQTYSYRKIKDVVLTNSAGIEHKGESSMATKERAFLDRIYVSKDYHFDNLHALDWDKVFEILPIYNNKRLEKKVKTYFKSEQI